MTGLFVHGGGADAYRFDADIVRRLRETLAGTVELEYPRVAGLERIEWPSTNAQLAPLLAALPGDAVLVAHSAGAVAAVKILSGSDTFAVRRVFLLAAPYKAEDSHWGIDEFTFPNDFAKRLRPYMELTIYHSKDDATIPVNDALLYKAKLPAARVDILDGYGHQFSGPLGFLANAIRTNAR